MGFKPGQFNMLYAFGVGEVPISISGDPADGSRLVHTIRDIGLVTHALCELEPGDVIGVRGPYGSHWPIEQHTGRDIVVAAGGIGLAPLRPVLYQVINHRDQYDDVVLLYGARQPDELLFPGEFDSWRKAGIQVEVTVDNADAAWVGRVGVVTTLVRYGKFEHDEASAFICGPEVMMRFTAQELENKGVAPDKLYISMERNMKCAIGFCGHCQLGPEFICMDGAVFVLPRMKRLMMIREL
jgi:NAD(P)H-flavin reductase